jgi:acetolactate synthase-1/2/3 large subunit
MEWPIDRRSLFQGAALAAGAALATRSTSAAPLDALRRRQNPGWVIGRYTGAQAVAETLLAENAWYVFGIPGAQENELWDEFKSRGVHYQLVTHEYSAAGMADGYARASGRPGILCVVPGPGVTNALTGLGEALLDSIPIVAIVGDVGNGAHAKPFQVHCLNQAELLKPVCKGVFTVCDVKQIPDAIRKAFQLAVCGEPGPTAVVIPYNLLIEVAEFKSGPLPPAGLPCDDGACARAIALLSDKRKRVGIYAGLGCMESGPSLAAVAELLQAPIATSVSGKGVVNECHPLAVGWGYGAHASVVAESAFEREKLHPLRSGVDVLLAIGVKFSEVSTGYYGNPRPKHVIHVDANEANLGRSMPADICVHSDAALFLSKLVECGDAIRRPKDDKLVSRIKQAKAEQQLELKAVPAAKCGVDPLATIAALRRHLCDDALLFTDVSLSEHLAAEYYRVLHPRTYFNPVDNQSMGWSIPAALGAARAVPGRTIATLTGDGCFLMSAMELVTAARDGLPVKVVVLDDRSYHYMQVLQQAAYRRTTATKLGCIDYRAFAQAVGVAFQDIQSHEHLDGGLRAAFCHEGPVLVRVQTDYGDRKIRWIEAVRDRYTADLSAAQKARFAARIGARTLNLRPEKND